MSVQVGKWRNSLGLRIPGALAKELGHAEGTEVHIQLVSGTLVLRPIMPKTTYKVSLEELLDAIMADKRVPTFLGHHCV